jgi:L-alanine-DL-glutamate epimerase-like enolase superfamily enzyme
MKITGIEAIVLNVPYEHGAPKPPMSSGGTRTTMDAIAVRVDTDEGLTGWGEAFGFATIPVTVSAIEQVIGPAAIGLDAADIAGTTTQLKRRFQNMMHGGPARFAVSALDIALWDIAGQAAGVPVCQLLRRAMSDNRPLPASLTAYASLFRLPTPADVGRICEEAASRGYRHVKLHEKTPEAVAAARTALGPDLALMVDVNCAFDEPGAIAFARAIAPHAPDWLEEPLFPTDDYEALARIRAGGGVPLSIGENLGNPNDVKRLGEHKAVNVVQPSVVKIGGISDVVRVFAIGREAGLRVVPHAPFIGPGLTATVHLVAALAEDEWVEHRYCDLEASPFGPSILAENGRLPVPEGPGLGLAPDPALIARYRVN